MNSPKIVVSTGWRFEPEYMLEDWKTNTSWFDGQIIYDDRERDSADRWIDESFLYTELRRMALEQGADWIAHISIDERLDLNAETIIRERINYLKRTTLRLPVKELYTPTSYRDNKGFWQHEESRIYPLLEDNVYSDVPFHNPIAPLREHDRFMQLMSIPVNIYHQKMIEPSSRENRVKIYNEVDPTASLIVLNEYEYLTNEDNIILKEIEKPYGYIPPYRTFKYETGTQ